MSQFKRKGDKTKYVFVDDRCIGRTCWAPGMFQHRAQLAGGGSMNTSSPDTATCMNRAYHGCPEGPDGERTEQCAHQHTDLTASQLVDGVCSDCGGHGIIIHIGLPIYSIDLAKQRKANGWRKA